MSRLLRFFLLLSSPHTFVYHRITESFRWEGPRQVSSPASKQGSRGFDTRLLSALSSRGRAPTGLQGQILNLVEETFLFTCQSLSCFSLWLLSHRPATHRCDEPDLVSHEPSCRYGKAATRSPPKAISSPDSTSPASSASPHSIFKNKSLLSLNLVLPGLCIPSVLVFISTEELLSTARI